MSEGDRVKARCKRCETPLATGDEVWDDEEDRVAEGFCLDVTCPFNDYPQNDIRGWSGHSDWNDKLEKLGVYDGTYKPPEAPTLEYKQDIGVGDDAWGKQLAYPAFTTLRELFSEWKWWRLSEGLSKKYPQHQGVSDFCSCHSTDLENSLHVKARPEVVKWINEHMIRADHDSWYFELISRGDGMLVVVKNNQILASRWLALLNTEQTMREIQHHEI